MKKFIKASLFGIGLGLLEAGALLCLQKRSSANTETANKEAESTSNENGQLSQIASNPTIGPNTPQNRLQDLTPHA